MDNFNKFKQFFAGPRIIFAILGFILLGEIVYAVKTLTLPVTPQSVFQAPVQQRMGRMSLEAPKASYNVAEVIPVSVMVDTGSKEVSGIDLIVQYDPKVFEATQAGLVKGKIMDEYPLMGVDSEKGLISISGISSLKSGFTGQGQFAAINFRTKSPGKTSLIINFQKGSTVFSNLVESSTVLNILDTVDNLELEVR